MKQKLSLLLLALTIGLLPVLANEPARVILNAGNVEHINVSGDMEIVLLQAPANEHSVIMDDNASERINLLLNNKSLFITDRGLFSKEKTVVYLYVNNLKTLTVEGTSNVKTIGSLSTAKLDVYVDGTSKVHIRTMGTVQAHGLNDSEIQVKYLSNGTISKRAY